MNHIFSQPENEQSDATTTSTHTLWVLRKNIKPLLFLCSLLLLSCNNPDQKQTPEFAKSKKNIKSVQFIEVPLAQTHEEITHMRVSPELIVHYDDGTTGSYPLSYQPLLKMGDKVGQGTLGLITDINGNAITAKDGSPFISQDPDGNSFISIGGRHFLITHMESMPGSIYKTELKLQGDQLKALNTEPVDFKTTAGTIINCASSKTPWNTHLGGEEDYSLNTIYTVPESPYYQNCAVKDGRITRARVDGTHSYFCAYIHGMQTYLKDDTIDKNEGYNGQKFTPYNYGYTVEVKLNDDGSTQTAKHYVTGKYTPELGLVMPDQKTIYVSDDGNAKGLWKFVSDHPIRGFNQNWQGSLFAARVKQLSAKNGGDFSVSWIKLGHASDREIKTLIDQKLKITDIFNLGLPDEHKKCPENYTKIYEDGRLECLQLKKGQQRAAAFLETRKYATYLGATIEFKKEEGLAYDANNNKLYVAISRINGSMEDNYKGRETTNHIRLPKNDCGGIYALELDKQFSATRMKAILTGQPLKPGDDYADQNACSPQTIANPDNLYFPGRDILLVSEDSTRHLNNMAWAYNVKTTELTRIASLPIGAEVTGVTNAIIGDKDFLFMTQQHPFSDQPINANHEKTAVQLMQQARDDDLNATLGYIAGIPAGVFVE